MSKKEELEKKLTDEEVGAVTGGGGQHQRAGMHLPPEDHEAASVIGDNDVIWLYEGSVDHYDVTVDTPVGTQIKTPPAAAE